MPNIIFNIPLYLTAIAPYIYTYRTRTQAHGRRFNSQPEALELLVTINQKSENDSIAFITKEICTTLIILSFQIGSRQISPPLVASWIPVALLF